MVEQIILKPFSEDNIERTYDFIQDKNFRYLFMMNGEPVWDNHLNYFHKILNDPNQKVFAIYLNNTHIGNCGFKYIKPNEEAELWVYIGSIEHKGKGYGYLACKELINFGLKELNLKFIVLHVAKYNDIAQNLYKKLGFKFVDLDNNTKEIWGEKSESLLKMKINRGN